jgi:ABC-type phosphate/phosphonate transport system substrate-binding protein
MKGMIKIPCVVAAACLLIAGCRSAQGISVKQFEETAFVPSGELTASSQDSLLTIKLVVNETYCTKTACSCISNLATRNYDKLQELLKSNYNIDLQLYYFSEEYDMKDSLMAGHYDGAICKPWLAFMHLQDTIGSRFNFKRVADLLDPNDNKWLTGIFIVKKDSPIQTLEEISGKILAAGQEDSYEKYHAPLTILSSKSIKPKSIINKASCTECINCLLDNEADVAVVSDYALNASCAVDIVKPEDFRIIGRTDKIPLCSVIIDLSKIKESDALRLQKALLDLSGDNTPEGLSCRGFVMPASWKPAPIISYETK